MHVVLATQITAELGERMFKFNPGAFLAGFDSTSIDYRL